jgi:hypothetical protein
VDLIDFGSGSGRFSIDLGFPGVDASGERFSTEIIAYLKLPAGSYTMGITAGFAATVDVDDDGWRLFCGANPRSFFATKVAEFFHSGASYPTDAEMLLGNTNEFTSTTKPSRHNLSIGSATSSSSSILPTPAGPVPRTACAWNSRTQPG